MPLQVKISDEAGVAKLIQTAQVCGSRRTYCARGVSPLGLANAGVVLPLRTELSVRRVPCPLRTGVSHRGVTLVLPKVAWFSCS